MIKAGFISLGCVKNLVDTEVMLGLMADNNIEIIDNAEEADYLIVNTCGFIETAKEESINAILEMAEYKKHGRCRGLIVAGCLGQRYHQDLLIEIPEIDAIIGTSSWHLILDAIKNIAEGRRVVFVEENNLQIYDDNTPRILTTPVYSSYVKIAEGCSNCCSYCVIPLVRGKFRSRPIESIVAEVRKMSLAGVKEINLIAQDTTSYGRDLYGEPRLAVLLAELIKIPDIHWIRLLYCYPKYLNDKLIELIAQEPKICKYIDLPLQHIHDDILRKMNRQDTSKSIKELLAKLRQKIPGVVIRTSFIAGFPGETKEHFNTLKEFIIEQRFEHVGIFAYSREEGTAAYELEDQVAAEVKEERYHYLMALQCHISEEINTNMEGTYTSVLVEGISQGQSKIAFGRSYREAPDIDGRIYIENASLSEPGDIVAVKIIQGFAYDLLAEKI